eukprot:727686-Pyramimonas_sp.AAC.1
MRPPHTVQRFVAPWGAPRKAPVAPYGAPRKRPPSRGPIWSSTEGPNGTARMRRPPPSAAL